MLKLTNQLGFLCGLFTQVSCPHKEKGEGIYCFTTLMEVRSTLRGTNKTEADLYDSG